MGNGTAQRDAAVLALLRRCDATRPQIAESTGMSKPTVSAAIAHLERAGLVRSDGQATGGAGRNPVVYTLNATARLVAGIDVGGVNTRVAVADLRGEILAEDARPTDHDGVTVQVVTMLRRLRARVAWAVDRGRPGGVATPLSGAVLSTPGIVTDASRVLLAYNVDAAGVLDFTPVARRLRVPLRVENNVNLAAIGEHRRGAARGVRHFLLLSVGAGIGVGTVVDGVLLRGANGAAGEISYLPFGARPLHEKQAPTGNFEVATAAAGLLARAQAQAWPKGPPRDVAELFARADSGDQVARALVLDEGRRIGLAVVAARAMVDPELVVLGGGIGRNEQLLAPVARACERLLPVPCPIVTTELADRGSLVGAVVSAADDEWQRILPSAGGGATDNHGGGS